MFQIDDPTAAAVMPTPEAAGTQGWFTEGNPATNTPATNVRASFLNGLTKELMNLLAEVGTTPAKTTYTQVRDAIYAMIAAKSTASLASSGWQKLPSGLIIQWGSVSATGSVTGSYYTATATWTYPMTFPTGLLQVFTVANNTGNILDTANPNSSPGLGSCGVTFVSSTDGGITALSARCLAIGY